MLENRLWSFLGFVVACGGPMACDTLSVEDQQSLQNDVLNAAAAHGHPGGHHGASRPPGVPLPGGSLDPTAIPKFVSPLRLLDVMPQAGSVRVGRKKIPYYEIEVVQITQQILPATDKKGKPTGLAPTTVWTYAAVDHPETRAYPANTLEARKDQPIRIKWINNLKDPETGTFLPHLLPVDQTLHWANPGKLMCHDGTSRTDCRPHEPPQSPYEGPVPIVTHVHGAHVDPESDGYPEAWYLPDATDIPANFATQGRLFGQVAGVATTPGAATFQYRNDQSSATLWYHDHSLGLTRTNVYAGPAGFYLVRSREEDQLSLPSRDIESNSRLRPSVREIPLMIQDRAFNDDGSLFYPDNRDFFEGLEPGTLDELGVRFTPEGESDIGPLWQPEFFGNTLVVNGRTWPKLTVERARYRFRMLNASNSRFLILRFQDDRLPFVRIGGDQGFLPAPLLQNRLLLGPSERADVVVDFSSLPSGTRIVLENVGPDEPFGGGEPCLEPGSTPEDGSCAFAPADPGTTGVVMAFDVVRTGARDPSRIPGSLPVGDLDLVPEHVRRISLNELESATEQVCMNEATEELILTPGSANDAVVCAQAGGTLEAFAPAAAVLGTVDDALASTPLFWGDAVTENPALGATEQWEIYNFTEDAHPIHLHLVQFRVVERQPFTVEESGPVLVDGEQRSEEPWETGFKDTVIAYPGEVTRIVAKFDIEGLYVWHCHILEHEDNEMMRPYCVGDLDACPVPAVAAHHGP